jgi:hypothetical protein
MAQGAGFKKARGKFFPFAEYTSGEKISSIRVDFPWSENTLKIIRDIPIELL